MQRQWHLCWVLGDQRATSTPAKVAEQLSPSIESCGESKCLYIDLKTVKICVGYVCLTCICNKTCIYIIYSHSFLDGFLLVQHCLGLVWLTAKQGPQSQHKEHWVDLAVEWDKSPDLTSHSDETYNNDEYHWCYKCKDGTMLSRQPATIRGNKVMQFFHVEWWLTKQVLHFFHRHHIVQSELPVQQPQTGEGHLTCGGQ